MPMTSNKCPKCGGKMHTKSPGKDKPHSAFKGEKPDQAKHKKMKQSGGPTGRKYERI